MPTKVKELNNLKEGDRHNCVLCCPSKRMVPEDKVWEFANRTGLYPWVDEGERGV